jgi:hypothetical protein
VGGLVDAYSLSIYDTLTTDKVETPQSNPYVIKLTNVQDLNSSERNSHQDIKLSTCGGDGSAEYITLQRLLKVMQSRSKRRTSQRSACS